VTPGTYNITINGTVSVFNYGTYGGGAELVDILQWGNNFSFGNSGGAFQSCSSLSAITATDSPNLVGITNLSGMFIGTSNLLTGNLNSWNVSNVTNMNGMFNSSYNFNGNIGSWNVSKVTNMGGMFTNCSFFNDNISSWNVSKVTDMGYMFQFTSAFNQNISSWNVSKVTDMNAMFQFATAFNQNIGSWNVSGVTNMNYFLNFANSFTSANLDAIYNGWSTLPSLKPSVNFVADICYDSSASAGRAILTAAPNNWTITDGGVCP
jgi:surface protein